MWRQEVPVEEVDRQEKDDKFHVFAMLMTAQRYDFAGKGQGARRKKQKCLEDDPASLQYQITNASTTLSTSTQVKVERSCQERNPTSIQ